MKLTLNKIIQEEIVGGLNVCYQLSIGEKEYDLTYSFSAFDCKLHPIAERFDPIVILFLHYALCRGIDFESQYPISQELYYSITRHVIPHIVACNKNCTQEIAINAPRIKGKLEGDWVGSGVSCGVDSLAAIYEYTKDIELEDYRLTHLVYFKAGQQAEMLNRFDAEAEKKHFLGGVQNAISFSKNVGLPLITGESNINEIANDAFGYTAVSRIFTLRNIGSIMILQNHFSKYIFASSHGDINSFKVDVNGDIGDYERWLIPMISTDSLHVYSASKAMERIEKTALLVDYPASYDHLSVCWRTARNCGYCPKCVRTLMTLDLLGALDKYKNVFDIDSYYKRKRVFFAYAYYKHKKDHFYNEIICLMENNGLPKPPVWDIIRICIKKLKNGLYPFVKE